MKKQLLPLFMVTLLATCGTVNAAEKEVADAVEKTGIVATVKGYAFGVKTRAADSFVSAKNGVTGSWEYARNKGVTGCTKDGYGYCVDTAVPTVRANVLGTAFGALLGYEGFEFISQNCSWFKDKAKVCKIGKIASAILVASYSAANFNSPKAKVLLALAALGTTGVNHHEELEELVCCQ